MGTKFVSVHVDEISEDKVTLPGISASAVIHQATVIVFETPPPPKSFKEVHLFCNALMIIQDKSLF